MALPLGSMNPRPPLRILFVCGSINQTTQMHQVARELPEHQHVFTPYYCDGLLEQARRRGLAEFTVAGEKLAGRCLSYLRREGLDVDYRGLRGLRGPYDLVISCSDLVVQGNLRGTPWSSCRRAFSTRKAGSTDCGAASRSCRAGSAARRPPA